MTCSIWARVGTVWAAKKRKSTIYKIRRELTCSFTALFDDLRKDALARSAGRRRRASTVICILVGPGLKKVDNHMTQCSVGGLGVLKGEAVGRHNGVLSPTALHSIRTIRWPEYCRWSALFHERCGGMCVYARFTVSVKCECSLCRWSVIIVRYLWAMIS